MVTFARAQRLTARIGLNLSPASTVAICGGCVVALAFLVMPTVLLERMVSASGFPAIMAAAEPPLGVTARVALALLFGGGFAGCAWLGLSLLAGERPLEKPFSQAAGMLRRADIHPDAPPRPPLFANRDLGVPLLLEDHDLVSGVGGGPALEPDTETDLPTVPVIARQIAADPIPLVERPLPRDLDQPLADYSAIPVLAEPPLRSEPFAPFERPAPPSLRAAPAVSERLNQAAPDPGPPAVPPHEPDDAADVTIQDLLARLEAGLSRRVEAPQPPVQAPAQAPVRGSLQDTLGDLRRLATGG